MARYDYSLDVGQSIETDEKIKEMEKKQPKGCCNAPTPPDKVTGDTQEEEKPETNEEKPVEEEQLENIPEEPQEKEEESKQKEEKVEIKPISFEKAKLISDFEQKPKEEEKPEGKEPEEDEQDVNEFLEESFNRESKEHEEIQNNKNNKETVIEEPSNRKKWVIAAVVIIIAILASALGYMYFKEPAEPTGAVVTPEIINITQILQKNVTNETIVEPIEEKNVSVENVLDDFTAALKD